MKTIFLLLNYLEKDQKIRNGLLLVLRELAITKIVYTKIGSLRVMPMMNLSISNTKEFIQR